MPEPALRVTGSLTSWTGGSRSTPTPTVPQHPPRYRTRTDHGLGDTIPLVLDGQVFTTNPQAVRFDGPGGTANVTAFAGGATDREVRLTIPAALQNGIYDVRVVLVGPGNDTTNARQLQVIPRLASPIGLAVVTAAGAQVHRLTLNGARLNGADVRVLIDGEAHFAGANANASQVAFSLGRKLDSGVHAVALVVDGSASHSVDLEVP